jgi:translation initiation factor IF-3
MRPRGGRRTDNERDRGPQTRVNEMIRVPQVQLIGEDGANRGVVAIGEAQRYAEEKSLDLVEISPTAKPPVCRVMDFGKWKYEQNIKEKEARRNRSQIITKEIKYRPKIGKADYDTKTNHVRRFLEADDKVKVTIMFRGREMAHPELGRNILERVAEDVSDMAIIETRPNLEGRNMTMMLAPMKKQEEKPAPDKAAPEKAAPEKAAAPAAADKEAAPAATKEAAPAAEKEAAPVEAAPAKAAPAAKAPAAKKEAAPKAAEAPAAPEESTVLASTDAPAAK